MLSDSSSPYLLLEDVVDLMAMKVRAGTFPSAAEWGVPEVLAYVSQQSILGAV
jgi:hypothetical protein